MGKTNLWERFGWWMNRDQETWFLFDKMETDWLAVVEYGIWHSFHMSARLVIFMEKKIEEEMEAYQSHRDLMGEWMGENK